MKNTENRNTQQRRRERVVRAARRRDLAADALMACNVVQGVRCNLMKQGEVSDVLRDWNRTAVDGLGEVACLLLEVAEELRGGGEHGKC